MIRNALSRRIIAGTPDSLPIEYAVQFGDQKRDYDMKAYPFFYNFIKSPYQVGTVDDSFGANQDIGIYRVTSDSAEGPDGLTLPVGGTLDIPIVMDNDTNFHLLYAKYGAFRISAFSITLADANTLSQPANDLLVTGNTIVFDSLTTIVGLIVGQVYFVIGAGASTFQVSLTSGGAAVVLGSVVVTTDAGDTFAQPTVAFSNDQRVTIDALTGTTGPVIGTNYFVISAGASTFQISLTSGGAAIVLTTNGTATIRLTTGSATIRRQGGIAGSREYLIFPFNDTNPALPGHGLLPEQIANARIPYWTELDVSMYMRSSGDRDVYGGFQRLPIGGSVEEAPIPILDLQGKQDGLGMLKTAFQLTRSATVWIRVRSRSAFPLQVYGHLFGYKITG